MRLVLILAAVAALAGESTAEARHYRYHHTHSFTRPGHSGRGPHGLHKDNPTQIPIGTPVRAHGSSASR